MIKLKLKLMIRKLAWRSSIAVVVLTAAWFSSLANAEQPAPVILLLHGASPFPSESPAQDVWGRCPEPHHPEGTDFVCFLAKNGYQIGGVFGQSDNAANVVEPDVSSAGIVYLLSSPRDIQNSGLMERGREIGWTAKKLKTWYPDRPLAIVAFSMGGVAARAWMQGAVNGLDYADEVDRLITVASPHSGVIGSPRWISRFRSRIYRDLEVDSRLLVQLNRDLPLPTLCRYCSIVINSPATTQFDWERARFFRHLFAGPLTVARLPPMLALGGDDIVHVVSAQLNLTQVGFDFENRTGNRIDVRIVRPVGTQGSAPHGVTLHTQGPHLPETWSLILEQLEKQRITDAGVASYWAREMALFEAHRDCLRQHGIESTVRLGYFGSENGSGESANFAWRIQGHVRRLSLVDDVHISPFFSAGSCRVQVDSLGRLVCIGELLGR